jgi:hypothetical protein
LDGKIFKPRKLKFRKRLASLMIKAGLKKKKVYRKLKLVKPKKRKLVKGIKKRNRKLN